MSRSAVSILAGMLAFGLLASGAEAKSARCFTTDDGEYPCEFRATDNSGSFEISAEGKPTFSIVIEDTGTAFGYGDYGSGNVALPGNYIRSTSDPACWENDSTSTKICAW
jgi:hypothetical protein